MKMQTFVIFGNKTCEDKHSKDKNYRKVRP